MKAVDMVGGGEELKRFKFRRDVEEGESIINFMVARDVDDFAC